MTCLTEDVPGVTGNARVKTNSCQPSCILKERGFSFQSCKLGRNARRSSAQTTTWVFVASSLQMPKAHNLRLFEDKRPAAQFLAQICYREVSSEQVSNHHVLCGRFSTSTLEPNKIEISCEVYFSKCSRIPYQE